MAPPWENGYNLVDCLRKAESDQINKLKST